MPARRLKATAQRRRRVAPGSVATVVITPEESIDRKVIQLFALVGEGLSGATHALLAADRDAAIKLARADEIVDALQREIEDEVLERIADKRLDLDELTMLIAVLRMLPEIERSGDLAEHIARRAVRGLGREMSARSRGLIEQMGELAARMWRKATDAFADRSSNVATAVEELDDEMDDCHVTLTAEIVAGGMPIPVAIELALIGRFYERFGDHAVNIARRVRSFGPGAGQRESVPEGDAAPVDRSHDAAPG